MTSNVRLWFKIGSSSCKWVANIIKKLNKKIIRLYKTKPFWHFGKYLDFNKCSIYQKCTLLEQNASNKIFKLIEPSAVLFHSKMKTKANQKDGKSAETVTSFSVLGNVMLFE